MGGRESCPVDVARETRGNLVPNEKPLTEVTHKGQKVTFEDAVEFFKQVEDPSARCPFCSSVSWYVYLADHVGNTPIVPYTDSHGTFTSHFKTVQLSCSKCGYVRQHVLDRIVEWIKESRLAAPDNASGDGDNND
jgi:hypothetical protein